jgi:hypothetical protein
VALLVFQLVSVAYLIPVNLSGSAILPEFVESRNTANIPLSLSVALSTLNAIVALALAIILMWRSRNSQVAMLFSFIFLALITNGYILQVMEAVPSVIFSGRGILSSLAFLAIMYLFPDMRFVPDRIRYIFIVFGAMIIFCYLPTISNVGVASGVTYLGAIVGGGSFIFRYRRAGLSQRQQIKWLLFPFIGVVLLISVWAMAGSLLPRSIYPSVANFLGIIAQLIILSLPLSVGLAVLRYRLWDIDLIINRTLVYGAITVLITLLFFALLFLTQTLIGQTQPLVALLIAAPVSIFAFNPTQRFIQRQIDRRIFRLRYDLNEVAAAQKKPDIKNPGAFTGKVFGQYEALGVLGRGGMGEVYKGFGNNETVAIKLLLPDLAQQSDFRQRFEREAQTLARLNHPNIVKMKDSGISDEVHFLAMEYIEGEELSAVVKRGAVTDYLALNDWLRDIGAALDYLHGQGLVHRDLKASNIMLRPSSDGEILQAVIMDFGIARTDASGTRLTGTGAVGTIDYMAPEQIMAARDVDQRADVYALGIIVYELLIGERPFKGSAGQVLFAHLQQPAPDPRDTNPDVPRETAKAIMKALEKNPDDRFASAGEFVAALKTVQVA